MLQLSRLILSRRFQPNLTGVSTLIHSKDQIHLHHSREAMLK
jgi:hypothetical protein